MSHTFVSYDLCHVISGLTCYVFILFAAGNVSGNAPAIHLIYGFFNELLFPHFVLAATFLEIFIEVYRNFYEKILPEQIRRKVVKRPY